MTTFGFLAAIYISLGNDAVVLVAFSVPPLLIAFSQIYGCSSHRHFSVLEYGMQTKYLWEAEGIPEWMAWAETPVALIISGNFSIALKTKWTFGSHPHCSTLGLCNDQQDRSEQIPVLDLKEFAWSPLDNWEFSHHWQFKDHSLPQWEASTECFWGVGSVQAEQFFSYNEQSPTVRWCVHEIPLCRKKCFLAF